MNTYGSDILYITGNPASGKSVLGYLLDGHRCTAVTHCHDNFLSIFRDIECIDELTRSETLSDIMKSDGDEKIPNGIDIKELRANLPPGYYNLQRISEGTHSEHPSSRDEPIKYGRDFDFYQYERELFSDIARGENVTSEYLLKSIFHHLFRLNPEIRYNKKNEYFIGRGGSTPANWEYLLSEFEYSRILYIYRDPREIIASRKKYDTDKQIKRGRLHDLDYVNQAARTFEKKYDRYKLIDFEDIILDTEKTMNKVCEFLDIENSNIIYEPTLGGENINSTVPILGQINDTYTNELNKEQQQLLNIQYTDISIDDLIKLDNHIIYKHVGIKMNLILERQIKSRLKRIGKAILDE